MAHFAQACCAGHETDFNHSSKLNKFTDHFEPNCDYSFQFMPLVFNNLFSELLAYYCKPKMLLLCLNSSLN